MKTLTIEALIRCGACGHARLDHPDRAPCIVTICPCREFLPMDRIVPTGLTSEHPSLRQVPPVPSNGHKGSVHDH